MRLLITFSGAKYHDTTRRIVEDGPIFGADRVLVYDDAWLRAHPFYEVNRWIFDHPGDKNGKRGFGWYSWKPLVILDALERLKSISRHFVPTRPDVVLYVDADTVPIADLSPIYRIAEQDGGCFFKAQTHSNHRWCTRQCLFVMGQHEARYQFADAGVARFMAVNDESYRARQLLWEWLTYAVNPLATTFDPPAESTARSSEGKAVQVWLDEHPDFQEHRTEQAILTNLCHKHGFKLHRECDESGEESSEDRELYPQLFQQIRQGYCQNGEGSRWRNV